MTEQEIEPFEFIGGALCLDFCNTVGMHSSDHPDEQLHRYVDLVVWSQQAGLISAQEAEHLIDQANSRPAEADAVLKRAIIARETIYRILSAVAAERAPAGEDLAMLNSNLSDTLARLRIVRTGDGFVWSWRETADALDQMLWPVIRSAADLLTSEALATVRECASEDCGWLFLDLSRNHSRRWCDMKACGNRAKARRHYERQISNRKA